MNVAGCTQDMNEYVSKDFIDKLFQQKREPTFSSTHDQFIIPSTKVRRSGEIYSSFGHVRVS